VKKYTAESMSVAMKLVRDELGTDAVIISSREIFIGGFLGMFKKRKIEVIAAKEQSKERIPVIPKVKQAPYVAVTKQEPITRTTKQVEVLELESIKKSIELEKTNGEIERELKELKKLIKSMAQPTSQINTANPEIIQQMQRNLIEQELGFETVDRITKELVNRWYKTGAMATEEEVKEWIVELLIAEVKDINFGGISFTKKYINVVGPTGVGKTTTLAKLAAHCVLNHKKRVAFITTDTYRIAAIDQLMTYAKILNVPLEVCYNIDDFQKATEKFSHYDVVLIDTAGRNFRNQQYVEDLKQIIDFETELETFLVLAVTSKQKDMMDIYEQFSSIQISKFIFTKVDETSSYGSIYNMIQAYKLPVAYITNGQNVPDDLIEASAEKLMKTIVGDKHV